MTTDLTTPPTHHSPAGVIRHALLALWCAGSVGGVGAVPVPAETGVALPAQGTVGDSTTPSSVAAAAASSSTSSSGAWSLARAYTAALERDARLRAAKAQTTGVRERVVQAQAQLKPNVSFNASYFRNDLARTQPNLLGQDTTNKELYNSHNQSLQLRYPLYRPALQLGVTQAQAQVNDAQATLQSEVQSVGIRVSESYLQALIAQDREALLKVQQDIAAQQVDAARKRFAGGQGIRTDIDETQARLDWTLAQLLEAQQSRQTALLQLETMVQQPVTAVLSLNEHQWSHITQHTNAVPLQTWMSQAEAHSPDIQAMQARIEAAQAAVKLAQTGHKPTLDAIAMVTRSTSENVTSPRSSYTNRQIGVQFNLPLYAGGAVQSAVRQALAELTRQEESLDAVRRDLQVRVQKEWRGVTEGQRRTQALSQALASSNQVVMSVRRSFEAGVRTVLDVLNAEQQAQQARRDLAEARYGQVMSHLRLLSLCGQLDQTRIDQTSAWFTTPSAVTAVAP
jgi:outer membrane protein/protease secretion system outer membrane protein